MQRENTQETQTCAALEQRWENNRNTLLTAIAAHIDAILIVQSYSLGGAQIEFRLMRPHAGP